MLKKLTQAMFRLALPVLYGLAMQFFAFTVSFGHSHTAESRMWEGQPDRKPQVEITGTVTSAEDGGALPGVNILEKGTTNGVISDVDGKYSITVGDDATLIFSSIGFITQEVSVGNQSVIDMALATDVQSLEEVVVIGYGTQQKKDLTGSVSSISSKDINNALISTPDEALQGQIAGVQVHKNSHEPGGGISVRIRGTASLNAGGSPLYVIDGMPISTSVETGPGDGGTTGSSANPLNSIDPSSIASIDVLKDASATAIYGSRAANGVVLITTKQGESGTQHIDFKSSWGIQQVARKLDFMNAEQWAVQANERAEQLGVPPIYSDQQISSFGSGTDWQDVIFRQALEQKYDLAFSGGSEKVRYMIQGSHTNSEGIVRGSGFQRFGSTIRVDATPNDRLSIGGSLLFTASDNNKVRTDTKGYEGVSNVIDAVLEAPPTIPARDSAGQPVDMGNYTLGGGLENPLTITDGYRQLGNTLRLINNVHATYEFIEGLSFTTRLGADVYDFRYHEYFPIGSEASRGGGGVASQEDARNINILTENTLSFKKYFARKHNIDVLAGFTYQQEKQEVLAAGSHGFPSDYYLYNNLGLGTNPQAPYTNAGKWQLLSYLGRINYSFNDTYLLTASVRIDGSSKFGVNNKYGVFPSVAFAWRLENEPFIRNLDLFSQLKLRASYGETGNEAIGTYNSLSTIGTSFGTRSSYIFNGTAVPIASPSGVANPDLSWEKTSGWNIGLDMGFFNQQLLLSANYYHKNTTDLLLNVPIPIQTGFGSVLDNTGSMENKGLELELFSNNISGNFNWNTNFNISFNRNKVTSLAGADFIWSGWVGGGNVSTHSKNTVRIEPGYPIGMFYGSIYEGTWQSQQEIDEVGTMPSARPGDIRYKDVSGDGTYDAETDDVFLGNPNPDFSYGLRNSFNYKQWDLNVFVYGQYGNDVLNLTAEHYVLTGNGVSAKRLNRWTPENPNTDIPAAHAPTPQRVSSFWVEDGSFLRIQNVTLSYSLPVKKWQNAPLRNAQIGLAVDNLAVITGYSGYDPEVNAYGNSNTTQNMDRFAYPAARTFRLQINLGF